MADEPLTSYVPRLLLQLQAGGPRHWQAEGTLVFADVSGFTRLTEKLSQHGKAGAEEIVRTISDVFTVLLTATADGGDVLKFSGDALLLFYDGPDHAHRACHAALTMQRTLRAVGGIDSSSGRVRLRMSVGAHTGRFSFFCCGHDHLELYVLGEAASTTVAAESAAGAGQVLVSRATAAALPDARVGAERDDGVALRAVPALPPVEPDDDRAWEAPHGGGRSLARFVAPPLRDRLGVSDSEHEHRPATVAFVHFGGVDELVRTAGADETFTRVQALTTASMEALDEYEVLLTATDVGPDGGTLMLTAGAPDATGDDEARMLRVARRIVEAECGLPVRVGVNAGNVFVGVVGAPFRRTYSTMGAATNLAARTASAAAWGQVLATDAVVGAVANRFATTPVPDFNVKGRRLPVRARTVDRAADTDTWQADVSTPFVGRERELAVLTDALTRARRGRGGVVEVVGDPGSGKSRLVAELREHARDVTWVGASCDPYERTSAYRLAGGLLRRILDIPQDASPAAAGGLLREAVAASAPDLLPWLPLLAIPTGADVPPTGESAEVADRYRRVRIHQVVGDLLIALASRPGVFVIEDAEHADDASAELIAALLARMLPARPWLVVVTRTPATGGLHAGRGYDATQLHLSPLDAAAAHELADRLAERMPVPSHLRAQLVERAAGNPLFLAELIAAQQSAGATVPRSVEAIVAARIDRLDVDDRRALRYLAVLGDQFNAALLDAALAPLDVHSRQTDRWSRLQPFIARDADRFTFRNALVREVAYEGLTFRRRRDLHGRVADAIHAATDGRATQLPIHLIRAERWRDAWITARTAAEDARHGGANAVAGELYDMALRAARHLDLANVEIEQTALVAGDVWYRAGVWERALTAYSTAAAAATDAAGRLEVWLRRARVHHSAGRYSQALRQYAQTLHAARELDAGDASARYAARAHAGYASTRLGQGRPADAVDHARAALATAEPIGDRETVADTHHLLDRAHVALDDHTAAAYHRDQALLSFAEVGDLAAQGTVLHDLGADAQRTGRLEEALWLYERSHEVRTRAGDVLHAAASAHAIGEVLVRLGRLDEARQRFAEALRAWRGARAPEGVTQATRGLGVVALRSGDCAAACRHLREAADLAARIGAETLHAGIVLPLAEGLLGLGRYVEAWEVATGALRSADDRPDVPIEGQREAAVAHCVRGEALLRTGSLERAAAELTVARSLAERIDDNDLRTIADHLLVHATG